MVIHCNSPRVIWLLFSSNSELIWYVLRITSPTTWEPLTVALISVVSQECNTIGFTSHFMDLFSSASGVFVRQLSYSWPGIYLCLSLGIWKSGFDTGKIKRRWASQWFLMCCENFEILLIETRACFLTLFRDI